MSQKLERPAEEELKKLEDDLHRRVRQNISQNMKHPAEEGLSKKSKDKLHRWLKGVSPIIGSGHLMIESPGFMKKTLSQSQ
jgi:hypothetical protein